MENRSKLLHYPRLYDHGGSENYFLKAMKEITAYHAVKNPDYRRLLRHQGFRMETLCSIDDLEKIPPLPTLFLKRHTLFSQPESRLPVKATTSGTSGQKSVVGLDLNTGLFALEMCLRSFHHLGLITPMPANYLILGYEPDRKNKAGVVKTAFGFTLLAPALHREYALKATKDHTYKVNEDGLIRALLRYEKQRFPVRLMGLPAYHHMLLLRLKERGIRLKLHKNSYLCLGGGWKQFYFEKADKNELFDLAEETLGITRSRCIDFFGAVEHPVLYCSCQNQHFHVPVYSRVLIRDVNTLRPQEYGKPGLLNLISPLMRSMPLHSIITDDLAILHRGSECGCGNTAPYFELLGRAGLADVKTCAAGAAEYLK